MNESLRQFRDFFASLTLTVWLLALSILLVFFATLSQADLGVWGVQQKFFHSFFVLGKFPGTEIPIPVFPGGYFIGGLLFVNLLAAHFVRFKFTWRKSGIWLTHFGLILLLVGELLSGILQQDFQMRLDEGDTKNYSESYRYNELAVIDATDPKFDDVVAIPEKLLVAGEPVQHPTLPFRVIPKLYYPNTTLQMRRDAPNAPASQATQGFGPQIVATPIPVTTRDDDRNIPTAYVELVGPEGSLGTWLVSPQLPMPQTFSYAGRTWKLALRFERHYLPFSVNLVKFSHDIYAGTDIPKNFSSHVVLKGQGGATGDRDVLIYMNNPLRAAGLTFYQAGFDNNDRTTVLQVVRNPGWRLPYIACAMMALGLVMQFSLHLAAFAGRRRRSAKPAAAA